MHAKKFLCALFILQLFFVSCVKNEAAPSGGKSGNESGNDAETSESAKSDEYENLPVYQKTYGGAGVDILMGPFAWVETYTPEGLTGEILNDAIYMRNLAVEEKLDVKLNIIFVNDERHTQRDDAAPLFTKAVLSGDPIYDIYITSQAVMTLAARERHLVSYESLPWVDLSRTWWDRKASDSLNFGGKVFFGVNESNFSNLGMACVILFNKNLFAKEGIPYPYDLVRSGDWTYDEFAKIVRSGSKDLNGDGAIYIKDDQFGFSGWQWSVGPNLYAAMGASFVEKNSDNIPELSINSAKSFDVFEKVIDLFSGGGAYHNNMQDGDVWLDRDRFAGGYILMTDYRPYYLDYFRDMADDFGLVPHPKYDRNQNGYRQLVEQVGTFTGVPIICKDLELASAVIESLAIESQKTVMPQYYETILQTKFTRDGESADMIDIIAKNRVYNVYLESLGIMDVFSAMISKGNADLASLYEKREGRAKAEIEKIIENYSLD